MNFRVCIYARKSALYFWKRSLRNICSYKIVPDLPLIVVCTYYYPHTIKQYPIFALFNNAPIQPCAVLVVIEYVLAVKTEII